MKKGMRMIPGRRDQVRVFVSVHWFKGSKVQRLGFRVRRKSEQLFREF